MQKKLGGGDYILQDFFFHFNQEWDGLQMSPQVHPALHGGLILCKMFIIVQCFASTCTQYFNPQLLKLKVACLSVVLCADLFKN